MPVRGSEMYCSGSGWHSLLAICTQELCYLGIPPTYPLVAVITDTTSTLVFDVSAAVFEAAADFQTVFVAEADCTGYVTYTFLESS